MTVSSTYFEHKNIQKIMWISPNGNTKNVIDHLLIDVRHGLDVMDYKSYRGAKIDSDHYLAIAKLRARI